MGADGALTEQEAFELIAYLVSSAELTLIEPELYGVFRLLDAAGRLAERVAANRPDADPIFARLHAEIEQKKGWMMWDPPGFRAFAAELPRTVAETIDRTYPRA
jgi:hypothetical protein